MHQLHQLHQELTLQRTRPGPKAEGAEPRPADGPSSAGPLLPFAAALPEAPLSEVLEDAWGVTAREAKAQDVLLGAGEPLEVSEDPLQDFKRKLGCGWLGYVGVGGR